ncbi:MAG: DUF4373 domain-containing protein [Tyzzerella sp.]|nr:DUF4373 domain-containing protein [Tyzzerella sp.]
MPRPQKEGIDYFPFDVGFFDDKEKIKPVIARFAADGVALLLYLYCEIYKNGYYIKVDDDFVDIISMDLRMNKKKIRQMLAYFIKRSLFDDKLFSTVTVLTSGSIQRRYMFAVKERARKNCAPILVKKEYWLIPEKDIPEVNVRIENVLTSIKVIHFFDIPRKNEVIPRKNNSNSVENALKESKEKNNTYIYFSSPLLDSSFGLYVMSRRQNGDALSGEQIQLLKEELLSLSSDEEEQIAIVKKATVSGWKSFYPLSKKKNGGKSQPKKTNKFDNFKGRSYDYDKLERQLLGVE